MPEILNPDTKVTNTQTTQSPEKNNVDGQVTQLAANVNTDTQPKPRTKPKAGQAKPAQSIVQDEPVSIDEKLEEQNVFEPSNTKIGRAALPSVQLQHKINIIILISLGAIVLIVLFFILLGPKIFTIKQIEATGLVSLTINDIAVDSGLKPKENFFFVNTQAAENELKKIMRISEVTVERVFPNKLRFKITERKPVVSAILKIENQLVPVYFDAEGRVIAYVGDYGSTKNLGYEPPLLSGVEFPGFTIGTKIPTKDMPRFQNLFDSLVRIEKEAPSLLSAFSEIKMLHTAAGEDELYLYPVSPRLPIRLRTYFDADQLRAILLLLDVLKNSKTLEQLNIDLQEVDFRTGTAVYHKKRAVPVSENGGEAQ